MAATPFSKRDTFGTVNGGNVGGQNNTNTIFNTDNLESAVNAIKNTAATMNHPQVLAAEGTLMRYGERIKEMQKQCYEASTLVQKRKKELEPSPWAIRK